MGGVEVYNRIDSINMPLLIERDNKSNMLEKLQERIAKDESVLGSLKDKAYQAKLIDEELERRSLDYKSNYKEDKVLEADIKKVISEKKKAITQSLRDYKRNPNTSTKKSCVSSLKRVFGEIDVELTIFYEKGISKKNLEALVDLMSRICEECGAIAVVPLSYQKKVYKWQLISKDIPFDEKKEYQIREKKALKDAQAELELYKEKTKKLENDNSGLQSVIASIKEKLLEYEQEYNEDDATLIERYKDENSKLIETIEYEIREKNKSKIDKIKRDSEEKKEIRIAKHDEKKNLIQRDFEIKKETRKQVYDKKLEELHTEYSNKENNKNAEINSLNRQLTNNNSLLSQLRNEAYITNANLSNTSALSLITKSKLKKRIAEIGVNISQLENENDLLLRRLTDLSGYDYNAEYQSYYRINRNEYENDVLKIENECNTLLKENDFDLQDFVLSVESEKVVALNNIEKKIKEEIAKKTSAIKSPESMVEKYKKGLIKEIKTTKSSLAGFEEEFKEKSSLVDKQKQNIKTLEEKIDSFHEDFVVSEYGKEMITPLIKEKETSIKEAKILIRDVKKEISALNKTISQNEKEEKRKLKEKKRIQEENAKKEEKNRKRQEEIENRVKKELNDKKKDQEILKGKERSISEVKQIIKDLEGNENHILLKESSLIISDDGKRVITNSIVRKKFTQRKTIRGCSKYILIFYDNNGKEISDQRLLDQKDIGASTMISFELKSKNGFTDDNYYLLVFNFDTDELLCAYRYKINIAFSNDFDF